jgi:hypothetical protein
VTGSPRGRGRRAPWTLALAALLLPFGFPAAAAAVTPLTGVLVVGRAPDPDYTLVLPDIAVLSGEFVVAWSSSFSRYHGSEIYDWGAGISGRKVRADGTPGSAELPLAPVTRFTAVGAPRLAANAAAGFVVAWPSFDAGDALTSVRLSRFTRGGAVTSTTRLGHFPWSYQVIGSDDPQVTAAAVDVVGRSFAVWTELEPPSRLALLAQTVAPGGLPIPPRFPVTSRAGSKLHPDLAMDARGNAVLVYRSLEPDGTGAVFLRFYDPVGVPRGGDVRLPPTAAGAEQSEPAIALRGDGRFVVVWHENAKILAQRFAPPLKPVGAPIWINDGAGRVAGQPDVAVDAAGRFVVTWLEVDPDESHPRIFARAYAAAGTPLGRAFAVQTGHGDRIAFSPYWQPAVAAGAGGRFLIAWADPAFEGGESRIYARLFAIDGPPAATAGGDAATPEGAAP